MRIMEIERAIILATTTNSNPFKYISNTSGIFYMKYLTIHSIMIFTQDCLRSSVKNIHLQSLYLHNVEYKKVRT